VEVAGPLKHYRRGRPLLKGERRYCVTSKPSREVRRAGDAGQHLGRSSAESAVAGNVAREGGGDEIGFLIRNPIIGVYPSHPAMLVGRIARRTGPRQNRNFARSQSRMPS